MKIRPNPIQTETTVAQQNSNTLKSPDIKKEVLAETKNQQLSGQLAISIKSEKSLASMTRATELHSSVATARTAPAVTERIAQQHKLEQLRNQLDSLKNEKQVLMKQIMATTAEIMGAEFAHDDGRAAAASAKLEELKSQLAEVDVQIKSLLKEIEKVEQQENTEKDRLENQQEEQSTINSNLQKAAESYKQVLDAIDPKP